MPFRFELALYGDDELPIPVARWQGTPTDIQLSDSMLLFEGAEGAPNDNDWNLGDIGLIAAQVEAAATRLEHDRDALVRSAIDDGDDVPYVLFRPRDTVVEVSLMFFEHGAIRGLYAIDRERGSSARLYSWLATAPLAPPTWGPIAVPRDALIHAMRDQVGLVRKLYAAAGIAMADYPSDTAAPVVSPRVKRSDRQMVHVPAARVRIGLTPEEADRLAAELARMEKQLHQPGLSGFSPLIPDAVIRRRRSWLETAMPAHDVEVGAFDIDVFPVTNRQWAAYARESGRPVSVADNDRFVTGISWVDARAYAEHYQLDLPTEAEWEHAARDERSLFTWGDAYFPQGNLAFEAPVHHTYVVGTRPATASYLGVHDLLGQFGEYCADLFAPYSGADLALWNEHYPDWRGMRTVRGGYDLHQDATCVSRRGVPADEPRSHLKFRCVSRK